MLAIDRQRTRTALSVDKVRGKGIARSVVATLGALGLGAAASTIAVELGHRTAAPMAQIDLTQHEPKHAATTAPIDRLGPAELVEARVTDPEMVRDLVNHGDLHLADDLVEGAATAADR